MRISLYNWLEETIIFNENLGEAYFVANVNGQYQPVNVKGVKDPYELSEIVKYDLAQNSVDPSYYVMLDERVDSHRLGLLNNVKKYHFKNQLTFRELLNIKVECKKAA